MDPPQEDGALNDSIVFSGLVAHLDAPPPDRALPRSVRAALAPVVEEHFGDEAAWHASAISLAHTDPRHHVALFLHGLGAWWAWRGAGNDPSAVTGYSLGVYAAIVAADAVDLEDGVALVLASGEAIRAAGRDLGLVAVAGPAAEEIRFDGLVVSHRLAPGLNFVSGPRPALEAFGPTALADGALSVSTLPFPGEPHTPALDPFLGPLRELAETIDVRAPRRPLYDCARAGRIDGADGVRDLIREHLVRPVDFAGTMARLREDGARRFRVLGCCRGLERVLDLQQAEVCR